MFKIVLLTKTIHDKIDYLILNEEFKKNIAIENLKRIHDHSYMMLSFDEFVYLKKFKYNFWFNEEDPLNSLYLLNNDSDVFLKENQWTVNEKHFFNGFVIEKNNLEKYLKDAEEKALMAL